MSWLEVGQIVISLAGHDKGSCHVVTATDGDKVYIADGKHRKLASPKLKNSKHLQKTNDLIFSMEGMTDKALRCILREYNERSEKSPE